MADNVENIDNHQARVCECGSVEFNLLKSGSTECIKCGRREYFWYEQEEQDV